MEPREQAVILDRQERLDQLEQLEAPEFQVALVQVDVLDLQDLRVNLEPLASLEETVTQGALEELERQECQVLQEQPV